MQKGDFVESRETAASSAQPSPAIPLSMGNLCCTTWQCLLQRFELHCQILPHLKDV